MPAIAIIFAARRHAFALFFDRREQRKIRHAAARRSFLFPCFFLTLRPFSLSFSFTRCHAFAVSPAAASIIFRRYDSCLAPPLSSSLRQAGVHAAARRRRRRAMLSFRDAAFAA